MPLVTRSNEACDAIQAIPAGHGQVLPERVMERLADTPIETRREAICNDLRVKRMANVGTILDPARSVILGSTFLLNGSLPGLAPRDRLLDPAWLGNQVHDSRVACIHCNPANENAIAPDYPLGFHIADPRSASVDRRPATSASSRARPCCATATPKIGPKPDVSDISNRSGDRF